MSHTLSSFTKGVMDSKEDAYEIILVIFTNSILGVILLLFVQAGRGPLVVSEVTAMNRR